MRYTPEDYIMVGEKAEFVNKAFRDTPSYNNINIEDQLSKVTVPVLIIQREQDFVVGRNQPAWY